MREGKKVGEVEEVEEGLGYRSNLDKDFVKIATVASTSLNLFYLAAR
jgi:hypothetical protein